MDMVLECRDLIKVYGKEPIPALNLPYLGLPRGQVVGLLGPNGSGKTTLIKLACGLLTLTAGSVAVNGIAPNEQTKAWVSYLPDRSVLPDAMTIAQAMRFYADFYTDFDSAKAAELMRDLGLDTGRRLKELSKGNREKVQLILVMSRRAQLYLLDEPIGGVDPATRDYILKTIVGAVRPDATILISTHLIADVEPILGSALFLKNGVITMFDTIENLHNQYGKSVDALFREVFRC